MKRLAILAILFGVLASDVEAAKRPRNTTSGTNTNCGPGCSPTGGTVCVDLASKAADGSYLAIAPSSTAYAGKRVVRQSTVQMLTVVTCWKLQ